MFSVFRQRNLKGVILSVFLFIFFLSCFSGEVASNNLHLQNLQGLMALANANNPGN